jgi:hypothetical protein
MPKAPSKHYTHFNCASVVISGTRICHKGMRKSEEFNAQLKMQKYPKLQTKHVPGKNTEVNYQNMHKGNDKNNENLSHNSQF